MDPRKMYLRCKNSTLRILKNFQFLAILTSSKASETKEEIFSFSIVATLIFPKISLTSSRAEVKIWLRICRLRSFVNPNVVLTAQTASLKKKKNQTNSKIEVPFESGKAILRKFFAI